MDFSFGKRLCCGVVIVNDQAELLLCHVTGQDHWDLPKGGMNLGETPQQAALRETREETGLELAPAQLLDLGRFPFRARKDLHLFATRLPRLDTQKLWCSSHFADVNGHAQPEMDGFGWFSFSEVAVHCSRKLSQVLRERLDLLALLKQLQSSAANGELPANPALTEVTVPALREPAPIKTVRLALAA